MNPMFGRLVTAMVTPFTADLEVDYARARELAVRLRGQNHDALVVCGTTGESPTLSNAEKLRLFKEVREALPSECKVIAGTGSNNTRATIELSKAAADQGADALLLVAPYYNKPNQPMLYRHFTEVAEATTLPIMIYNIPGRTAVEIAPETLASLAEHPRIVAVKQSLPDVDPVSDLAARLANVKSSTPMWIYSGDDSHILSIMSAGGCGVVSVSGHLVGPEMARMMKDFEAGRVAEARATHLKLFPIFRGLFRVPNPVLVKAALGMLGFAVGGVRPPLYETDAVELGRLKTLLEEQGLLTRA